MLYLCATPIGNLADVTLRVLEVLARAEVVACEDTRHTRGLLARHGLQPGRLLSFHEHNEAAREEEILQLLREGREVALVSDAGMPGLSDPGHTLVRACVREGLPVTVLPGPSAVSTALVVSGLPTDRFLFVGFLPRGKKALVGALEEADGARATLVLFESPRRVRATLAAVAERWPQRRVALCRELTKVHEEVLRGTAGEVTALLAEPMRGEIVLVLEAEKSAGLGTVAGRPVGPAEIRAALARLLDQGVGTKTAASVVSELTGMPGRRAYELALAVKEKGPDGSLLE